MLVVWAVRGAVSSTWNKRSSRTLIQEPGLNALVIPLILAPLSSDWPQQSSKGIFSSSSLFKIMDVRCFPWIFQHPQADWHRKSEKCRMCTAHVWVALQSYILLLELYCLTLSQMYGCKAQRLRQMWLYTWWWQKVEIRSLLSWGFQFHC